MERYAALEHTPGPALAPGVHDEALFVQFTEQLYDSGFLFDDANETEIEKGQQVIQAFYTQANEMVMHHLSETHLDHFLNYLNDHPWTKKEKQHKIHTKILKEFEQLSYGSHHSFNIRRNIHLELLKSQHHTFREFLLYITAYYVLFLKKQTNKAEVHSSQSTEAPPSAATPSPSSESSLSEENQLLNQIAEEEIIEDIEDLDVREAPQKDEDMSVVYGTGKINKAACLQFIREYPDSALQFLFRLELTGKPLPIEFFEIYEEWETRGMKRSHVRKYILELLEWETLPSEGTLLELSNTLKDRISDLKYQTELEKYKTPART